jgi:hypothetical protein
VFLLRKLGVGPPGPHLGLLLVAQTSVSETNEKRLA